ncbi:hypothetical protein FOZ63_018560, partial [Perkinsus olseni]
DWFQPWPKDALRSVGEKFLAEVEQLGPADGALRAGVVDFLPFSFEAVGHQSEKFIEVERRFAYTTPKSFLELIKLYTSMLGKKLLALEDKQYRLSNGLDKLKETAEQVAGLEEVLKEKAVVVEQKAKEADAFAEEVGREKTK